MKFREVYRYEVAHRLRSLTTWAYALILGGLAFAMIAGGAPRAGVHGNAPVQLAYLSMLLSILGIVVTAGLFGDAAVRDARAGMDPLVFTTPLRRAEYLGGRFLGAFTINAIVLLAIPVGFTLPVLLGIPDAAAFGPVRPAALLQAYLLILLTNIAFTGAVLFTTGVLTRQTIPVYLAAIGLFVGTMIALGPDADDLVSPVMSVIGPLGFAALNEATVLWTAAERNTRLVGLPAHLLWNRLVWLSAASVVLALLHARFRFAHPDGGRRRRRAGRAVVDPAPSRARPVEMPRVRGSFHARTGFRQTLAIAGNALAEIAASRWFLVMLVACTGLTLLWGWNVAQTVFDTSIWPVTMLIAETVLSQRIVPFVFLLITLYAGELVWKDRDAGVSEIADAAPVPDAASLIGRFLALSVMIVLIQVATLVGGMLIQAFQGYFRFELGVYLPIVFGLNLADYILVAALAMTIHVVVNQKYLGHLIVILGFILPRAAAAIGIHHHLLRYGTGPGWTYSDMNGFGPFLEGFVWFRLYWAAWALLLVVIAAVFQVRGPETGAALRLRKARARFTGMVARTAGVAVLLIVVLGGFVFYNTNIRNEYVPPEEAGARQALYESRYGHLGERPQPEIFAADLRVEIRPYEAAADIGGTYRLVNRNDTAIDSLYVTFISPRPEVRDLSFDRAADAVLVDDETGFRIYALAEPLAPGDTMELRFDVEVRTHGFRNDEDLDGVFANGASFNRSWMPFVGYQRMVELSDATERERFGLAPVAPPDPDDPDARRFRQPFTDADRVHVRTILGTAPDQIAITPGVLRRSWTENGRQYFEYETEALESFGATVFSGRYAVLEDRWNDIALRIFHHPAHPYDLDRTMRAMKASLDYFTHAFGPYPDSQLRIVEIPRYGGFGHAHANTIAFTEDYFLSRVKHGEVDQPFYGTAHEVAHQWWGGMAGGARLPGAGFLSESLANYSAMMLVEHEFGRDEARRVYDFQMDRYLRGRGSQGREVPLLDVGDQPYIAYRKGAVAMYTLREHIGADAVNGALRRYFERFGNAGPPYPVSRDLYAELRAVTPDSLRSLLTDWFETVTLWELKADRAVVAPAGDGSFVVTLDVTARKLRADAEGSESEVPMDDLIEIGTFAAGPDGTRGERLYVEQRRLRSGAQTIRFRVPAEPAWAGVDPRRLLTERNRADNQVKVGSS